MRFTPTLVVLMLLISGLAAVAPATAAPERIDLGSDPLGADDAITQYEEDGSVKQNLTRYDMSIGYMDDAETLDWYEPSTASELGNEWLTVCYNEDIPREYTFIVDDSYFNPVTEEAVESRTGDVTAEYEPTEGRNGTRVTMTFNGAGCHAFPVSNADSFVFGYSGDLKERVENSTGWSPTIPGISGSPDWNLIKGSTLDDRTSVAIPITQENATVQYRVYSDGETRWRPVPESSQESHPVYTMTKDGDPDTTYVVSRTSEAPQVRWIEGTPGAGSSISSAIDDILSGLQDFIDDLTPNTPGSMVIVHA
ncbi:hypothetical protein N0B31_10220 [Salinirubellus salinus]|uniref:Uncharacterized protein n=1 Tax=Salinirubellus salinus TaxID=1364945 RepID=A0A9E7R8P5_9EURY|nr:hypothetical protein [Salinirubellus salinus]UWM56650.1 hypothetical protein N0B31_10220 [Salinirubellus salinus]